MRGLPQRALQMVSVWLHLSPIRFILAPAPLVLSTSRTTTESVRLHARLAPRAPTAPLAPPFPALRALTAPLTPWPPSLALRASGATTWALRPSLRVRRAWRERIAPLWAPRRPPHAPSVPRAPTAPTGWLSIALRDFFVPPLVRAPHSTALPAPRGATTLPAAPQQKLPALLAPRGPTRTALAPPPALHAPRARRRSFQTPPATQRARCAVRAATVACPVRPRA